MTTYHALALSHPNSIQKIYDNIHMLMDPYYYIPSIIFNMDETWVAPRRRRSVQSLSRIRQTCLLFRTQHLTGRTSPSSDASP